MNYFVFGDSHSACFESAFPTNVYVYPASSAKGLSNPYSKSGVNTQIIEKISLLADNSNIVLFFGKVDLDFVVNYKYNTTQIVNVKEYVLSIANSYIEVVKLNTLNKNVFICELPITHNDDESLLNAINEESHLNYVNSYLSENDCFEYRHFSKVLPYDERIVLYELFNTELKNKCEANNFTFLEINKYFINDNGQFEIPVKYINLGNKNDHHLLPNIGDLFLKSLQIN